MSQELETTEPEGTEANTASNVEQLDQDSTAETDEQWWAGQRIENIITRLFRVTVVIVCLNMVIAGANVAMIATRWSAPRQAPAAAPTQTASSPQPTNTATPPVPSAPPFTPSPQIAGSTPSPAPAPACPPAPTPVKEALPEKPVRLLGPLPGASRAAPVLARRQVRAPVGLGSRPPLSIDDEEDGAYDDPPRPVERW